MSRRSVTMARQTEECKCKCRHSFRFLDQVLIFDPKLFNVEGEVQTYDEVEKIYIKACDEGRKWNGMVDCIIETMSYDAVVIEAARLAQCHCCARHIIKN